jgi:hypothetical protein
MPLNSQKLDANQLLLEEDDYWWGSILNKEKRLEDFSVINDLEISEDLRA